MGYQGAVWLDREERDIEEAPERALEALNLKTGQAVADIGAGTGYMTVRMAKRVGPSGRVYAEDVQPVEGKDGLEEERCPVAHAGDDPDQPDNVEPAGDPAPARAAEPGRPPVGTAGGRHRDYRPYTQAKQHQAESSLIQSGVGFREWNQASPRRSDEPNDEK